MHTYIYTDNMKIYRYRYYIYNTYICTNCNTLCGFYGREFKMENSSCSPQLLMLCYGYTHTHTKTHTQIQNTYLHIVNTQNMYEVLQLFVALKEATK